MSLTIIHQNIQSLRNNYVKLSEYIENLQNLPDLIFLTELRIYSNESHHYNILPNYEFISSCNDNFRSGGVGIYIKSNISYTKKMSKVHTAGDIITIDVKYNDHDWCFICIYRYCNNNIFEILKSIKNHNLVIVGDLNANLLNNQSLNYIKLLEAKFNLRNIINSPTCDAACTDHIIFIRHSNNYKYKANNLNIGLTDHNLLFLKIKYQGENRIDTSKALLIPETKRNWIWKYFGFPSEDGQRYLTIDKVMCIICGTLVANSRNTTNLKSHFYTKHRDMLQKISDEKKCETVKQSEASFLCNECGKIFRKADVYNFHLNSKCGTEKLFECNECSSKFSTKRRLEAHKLIHDVSAKRHLCGYCDAGFLRKCQLIVHERSHTGEKPYKCDICNKEFSYRESLVTHSSVHTGIKPYACQACHLSFSCIGNLLKHRRIRPNTCGRPEYQKNYKIAPRASTRIKNDSDVSSTSETINERKNTLIYSPSSESPSMIEFSEVNRTNKENVIVQINDQANEEVKDNDSDTHVDEITEEYLQYTESDENSSSDEEDYVTGNWNDHSEEIRENYILEIEVQNTERPKPMSGTNYTIVAEQKIKDNETLINDAATENDCNKRMVVNIDNNEDETNYLQEENILEDEDDDKSMSHNVNIQQNRTEHHLIIENFHIKDEPEDPDKENVSEGLKHQKLNIQPRNHLIDEQDTQCEYDSQAYSSDAKHSTLIHKCTSCEVEINDCDVHLYFRCPKCSTYNSVEYKKSQEFGSQKNLGGPIMSPAVALSDHQYCDKVFLTKEKLEVLDRQYNDENLYDNSCNKTNKEGNRREDEYSIFGQFVANELHSLKSSNCKKLKRLIQKAILEITINDTESSENEDEPSLASVDKSQSHQQYRRQSSQYRWMAKKRNYNEMNSNNTTEYESPNSTTVLLGTSDNSNDNYNNQGNRREDEFSIFGQFVANELRSIKSPSNRKRLKLLIQKAILEITIDGM